MKLFKHTVEIQLSEEAQFTLSYMHPDDLGRIHDLSEEFTPRVNELIQLGLIAILITPKKTLELEDTHSPGYMVLTEIGEIFAKPLRETRIAKQEQDPEYIAYRNSKKRIDQKNNDIAYWAEMEEYVDNMHNQ